MKPWYLQTTYKNEEDRQTARILATLILAVWAVYLIVGLIGLYWRDWRLVTAALAGSVVQAVPWWLLRRGQLRAGSLISMLSALGTVTLIATVGQGIRDLAIVAFPIIFIFAGLTLNRALFRVCVGLTVAATGWLAFGEAKGWFVPQPFPEDLSIYLTGVIVLLMVAALAVDLLATNMRKNLEQAHHEIAQRKQAERFIKDIITKNPLSIQVLDKEGFTLEANSAHKLLFGSVPPADYSMFNDLQLAQQGMGEIFDQLRKGEVVHFPDVNYNAHDSIPEMPDVPVWVRTIGFPLCDSDEKPERFVLMHENITERKQAEIMLQDEKERIRTILDLVGDPIFVKDNDHRVILANRAFYNIFCLDENSVIGHTLEEAVPENERQHFLKVDRRVLDTGITDIREEALTVKDLTRTVITRKIRFIGEAGKRFLVGSIHDITERKQAESKLLETQLLLSAVVESTDDFIWSVDPERFGLLTFNKRLSDNFLETRGIHITTGMTPEDLFPSPDFVEAWDALYRRALREGSYKTEYIGKTRSQIMDLNFNLLQREGAIIGISVFGRDITARKRAEESLRLKNFVFDMSIAANSIADINGTITQANTAFLHAWGCPSQADVIGKPILYFLQNREEAVAIITALNQTGRWEGEFSARREDGSTFIAYGFATDLRNEKGEMMGYQSAIIDITERKRAEESLRQQNAYLKALQETALDLISQLDLPSLLENIVKRAEQLVGTCSGYLDLVEPRTPRLKPMVGRGVLAESLQFPVQPGESITGIVWQTGKPMVLADYDAWSGRIPVFKQNLIRSMIAVPLRSGSETLGVLGLAFERDTNRTFGEDDIPPLSDFARLAVIAIQNARLYSTAQDELAARKRAEETLQQQNQILIALQNTTLELVSQLNLKTLLENIVTRACALVGTSAGLLDLIDPATNQLIPQIGVGALEESLHLPIQLGEGLTGIVWQTGEMLVIPDYDQWARRLVGFSHGTLSSVIGVPLLAGAHVLGVLVIGSAYASPRHFDPDTIELLNQFAHLATVAVQNARLFSDLQAELIERKRAEAALRESEEKFRQLTEHSLLGVYLIQNGKFIYVNERFANVFGYEPYEMINTLGPQDILHPDDIQSVLSRLQERMKGKIESSPLAYKCVTKSGSEFFAEVYSTAINHQGEIAVMGTLMDVTERKRAEEKLLATLEEKETLLREVHHRVKNNLQAMIALITLRRGLAHDADTQQFLRELEGQARTMSLVYEQLYQAENLSQVGMATYLRQLTANVLETFGRSDLRLDLDAPLALDVAYAMPCGLIVNELFTNILKHAFPSGYQDLPTVRIAMWQEGETCHLTVSDNGVGLPRGFDWRAGRTLGLRLVELWVTHQLGGTIHVTTETGTTFAIAFDLGG